MCFIAYLSERIRLAASRCSIDRTCVRCGNGIRHVKSREIYVKVHGVSKICLYT